MILTRISIRYYIYTFLGITLLDAIHCIGFSTFVFNILQPRFWIIIQFSAPSIIFCNYNFGSFAYCSPCSLTSMSFFKTVGWADVFLVMFNMGGYKITSLWLFFSFFQVCFEIDFLSSCQNQPKRINPLNIPTRNPPLPFGPKPCHCQYILVMIFE